MMMSRFFLFQAIETSFHLPGKLHPPRKPVLIFFSSFSTNEEPDNPTFPKWRGLHCIPFQGGASPFTILINSFMASDPAEPASFSTCFSSSS